jgi:hypothetical protein
MRTTTRLPRLTLALLFMAWGNTAHAADSAAVRPHIIFILADDMGLGDLGCYGGKQAPTPRLDRLASEGTRFTQFYSASPVCSPPPPERYPLFQQRSWSVSLQTVVGASRPHSSLQPPATKSETSPPHTPGPPNPAPYPATGNPANTAPTTPPPPAAPLHPR